MALDIKATLRVCSKIHTLDQLVNLLGEPSKGFSLGDRFSRNKKRREHSYWSFDSSDIDPNESLDRHLNCIFEFYEKNIDSFEEIRDELLEFSVSCFLSSDNGQGGATLSSSSIAQINKMSVELTLDIYAD